MENTVLYGHILAAAIAFNGPSAARLKNTGAIARAKQNFRLPVLTLLLLNALLVFAALLYFSWAHMGWWPLLTFLIVSVSLGHKAGNLNSEGDTWAVMLVSVLAMSTTQWLLLAS